ncbi:MAG: NAD(P)/FAD-dependent oxidoreductase [Candidatus Omnitrophota bacterium]|nr:MAG: NAD(P)/FAD-dependent oxidoreductase [Candidatus Omnitrophota bacterium]
MVRKKPKIVIVGAGPIGCYLAQLLKERGFSPLLIEEHEELGRPVHCAGLVGKKVIDEIQIPFPRNCIINIINGGVVHLGKNSITLRREGVAYVIDREKFDKAMGKNLNIIFGTKYLGIEEKEKYIIETDKGELEADIVIGADGASSSVRNFVIPDKQISFLKGVQFRIKNDVFQKDMAEVFVRKPYFYWVIPEKDHTVRLGVLSQAPYHDLLEFIKERKLKGEILEKFGGLVTLTHFSPLNRKKAFLVGDSAAQIKPLSYGGIYMGMKAAEILADCISKEKYSDYSYLWAKKFGREIDLSLRARDIFQKMTDEELKEIFSFAKRKALFIEQKGNFENHSSLFREFLKNPSTSKEMAGILLKIIKADFRESI